MLRDDQYDHASGLPLPTLDESAEVSEADLLHGIRLRDAFVFQQIVRAKVAYTRPTSEQTGRSKAAESPKPVRPKLPAEPKRLPNKPPPVWSKGRGQWTPTYLYGKTAMPWLYDRETTKPATDSDNVVPLPRLT